ncbi:MAG: DUF1015 domain-containing protein [Anaerohalosphaeraceae bacterium]|nr:DUF1015 domain-containing protein [Anaerohalosphaeraceae bacterium]
MEIKSFKAYRFNSDVVAGVGKCISPPYDVINSVQQNLLYGRSSHNIVRIIKGKTESTDSDSNNQYTRAAGFLNEWIKAGALKQDSAEAIYAYVQNFDIAGTTYQRSGFVSLGRLKDFGSGVQPHEKTLDGPKADRLNLMKATAAQFGQIFMLFDDAEKIADKIIDSTVAAKESASDFVDDENVRHRLYIIDDTSDIKAIVNMMADKQALIADGHHRYETALNYWKQTKNPAAEYRMMTFVNMYNEGLVVLPTHRLLGNLESYNTDNLVVSLQKYFSVTKFECTSDKAKAKSLMDKKLAEAFAAGENAFGIYDGKSFYYVELKDKTALDNVDVSDASKSLGVVVLHSAILDDILGIDQAALTSESNLEYVKDIGDAVAEAMAKVDSGQKQALFFMNSTPVEQVKAVAVENEKMPQKSTFFYPKIFTGLTINKL